MNTIQELETPVHVETNVLYGTTQFDSVSKWTLWAAGRQVQEYRHLAGPQRGAHTGIPPYASLQLTSV
jgi:hypothetical protein